MQKSKFLTLVVLMVALTSVAVSLAMMEQADARNPIADLRNKGKQGEEASDGKRQGDDGIPWCPISNPDCV